MTHTSFIRVLILLMTVIRSVTLTPTSTPMVTSDADDPETGDVARETERSLLSMTLSEEMERLRSELRKDILRELDFRFKFDPNGNAHRPDYPHGHHHHHYYFHRTPALYDPGATETRDDDELSLRAFLQASESRWAATENRLRTAETKLRTMEERDQSEEEASQTHQATQSRSLSCEDKLLDTQQRLLSAENKLNLLDQTALGTQTPNATKQHGSTFIRWGRTACPNNTELVYSGIAGGSHLSHSGAASNRLCLTLQPQFDGTPATTNSNYLYGVEYEEMEGHHNHDAPCSVCRAPESNTIMVPATLTCPPGWTAQYTGHLMAGFHGHAAASEFLCLDVEPEHWAGGHEDKNGALLYNTRTVCGSLPCPPYVEGQVVTCVVCSK